MPKEIVVLSQDYDGCYAIMTEVGCNRLLEVGKAVWTQYEKIHGVGAALHKIQTVQTAYHSYLSQITKDAPRVHVYVGSNRQCFYSDKQNAAHNNNGSVFPALKTLCTTRSTEAQPWIFEPLLLADPKIIGIPYSRERGKAYQKIRNQFSRHGSHLLSDPEDIKDDSKKEMLLYQMWDAHRTNPDAEHINFHFIDDREDLLADALSSITSDMLPPNITFIVSRFHYIDCINGKTSGLGCRGLIKSEAAAPSSALGTTTPSAPTAPCPLDWLEDIMHDDSESDAESALSEIPDRSALIKYSFWTKPAAPDPAQPSNEDNTGAAASSSAPVESSSYS